VQRCISTIKLLKCFITTNSLAQRLHANPLAPGIYLYSSLWVNRVFSLSIYYHFFFSIYSARVRHCVGTARWRKRTSVNTYGLSSGVKPYYVFERCTHHVKPYASLGRVIIVIFMTLCVCTYLAHHKALSSFVIPVVYTCICERIHMLRKNNQRSGYMVLLVDYFKTIVTRAYGLRSAFSQIRMYCYYYRIITIHIS
jgi:hypothetical protein